MRKPSFYILDLEGETQVVSLGSKCSYPLGYTARLELTTSFKKKIRKDCFQVFLNWMEGKSTLGIWKSPLLCLPKNVSLVFMLVECCVHCKVPLSVHPIV